MMTLNSQVIISEEIEKTLASLEALRRDETIIEIISPSIVSEKSSSEPDEPCTPFVHRIVTEKEIFSLDDARLATEKAYMASQEVTIIILAAKSFSAIVQNKLLKVLEEPPAKKEFILITPHKSTILGTIRSRLPIVVLKEQKIEALSELSFPGLSLSTVYAFVQTHKRTDTKAMKSVVEGIGKEVMTSGQFDLDEKTLTLFSNATLALDVGSPPVFVLTTLLLKLLARKKR